MLGRSVDTQFAERGDAGMASGRSVDVLRWHGASSALAAAPGGEHRLLLLTGIASAAFLTVVAVFGILDDRRGAIGFGLIVLIVTPAIVCPLLPAGGGGTFLDGWIIGFWGVVAGVVVLCIWAPRLLFGGGSVGRRRLRS
jgi:hypothetical protein